MFTPRHLKVLVHAAKQLEKLERYERDRLTHAQIVSLRNSADGMRRAARERVGAQAAGPLLDQAEKLHASCSPLVRFPALVENIDVILVAVVLAVGIRAFFMQPFKIPTNSMYPSLRGVVVDVYRPGEQMPSMARQWLEKIFLGRDYVDFLAPADAEVPRIRTGGFSYFSRADLAFLTPNGVSTVRLWTEASASDIAGPSDPIRPAMLAAAGWRPHGPAVRVRARVSTGDHLFVNKVAYNFRAPRRGEPFVFRTEGLATDDARARGLLYMSPQRRRLAGSQFYIKRCVGVGGDELRIDAPRLFVNGEPAKEPSIRNVWEAMPTDPRYRGYANPPSASFLNSPSQTVKLAPQQYWPMGDNSYSSLDARYFGAVPVSNLVGNAFFIYFPLDRFLHSIR
jgi:signal peptidase I